MAAGGEDGSVRTWEVATGKEGVPLPAHAGAVRSVAFSPDGKLVASGGEDKIVVLHDLAGGGRREFVAPAVVHEVAFSPDGRTLAAVGDGPEAGVRLWDLETGAATAWRGHKGAARGLALAPAAPLLATCGEDGTVTLWDRTAGAPGCGRAARGRSAAACGRWRSRRTAATWPRPTPTGRCICCG